MLSIVIILVIMHMDANMSVGDSNISKEISHIMRVVQPIIIIIIIGTYIAPFPFIKCSKALHIVIV